jgi:hypothetical protein
VCIRLADGTLLKRQRIGLGHAVRGGRRVWGAGGAATSWARALIDGGRIVTDPDRTARLEVCTEVVYGRSSDCGVQVSCGCEVDLVTVERDLYTVAPMTIT